MSEKELENEFEKELSADEINEADAAPEQEWEFEATAHTLDDSLELSDGFQLDMAEEIVPKATVPNQLVGADETESKPKSKAPVKIILGCVAAVLVIAVLAFLGVRYYTAPNTEEKLNPGNVAVTIGNTDVSVGLYDYFYTTVVYEYEMYAGYGYNNLDTSMDYSLQYTEDENGNQITWLEKFKLDTLNRIKMIMFYYEKGVDAGVKLTAEQQAEIDNQIEGLESAAAEQNISVNEYITRNYGKYCGVATLREYLRKYFIASAYFNMMSIDERPEDEAVEAYFNENKQNYMSCDYAIIEMPYDTTDEATMAASEKKVSEYTGKINSLEAMKQLMPEACKDFIDQYIEYGYFQSTEEAVEALSDSLEMSDSRVKIASNYDENIANWLFSEATAIGMTNYYLDEQSSVATIILKTGEPELDETEVYSVRHILIMPESAAADENAEQEQAATDKQFTEAEWQAAEAKANEILAGFNEGEKTEKVFAELAEQYSADTESTSKGSSGLYGGAIEGVSLGQMVPEFESWAIDKSRSYGDVGIVKSEFGYHIMFFLYDGPSCKFKAKQDLMNELQQEEFDNSPIKEHSAIKKTKASGKA